MFYHDDSHIIIHIIWIYNDIILKKYSILGYFEKA